MWQKKGGEKGMMTVEATLSLVPFIIAILGIITFTNIFVVHNKIQYALYQMGNELSGYTYFYQALGLRTGDLALKGDIDSQTEKLDGTINDLSNFIAQIGSLEDSINGVGNGSSSLNQVVQQGQAVVNQGGQTVNSVRDIISDPKALLRGFIYLGVEKAEGAAKTLLLEIISEGLLEVYLDESFAKYNAMTADEYLKYFGVRGGISGLDFSRSELFSDDDYRMIDIAVEYDVEVYILKLFLKDPTIHVVQRCSVPAWLDGDGVTYSK